MIPPLPTAAGPQLAMQAFARFDSPEVIRRVDRARRRALARSGALVRTIARRSIRRRRKASPPGQPPSTHTGALKGTIRFGYDAVKDTVVIGPMPPRQDADLWELHEHGGRARLRPFRHRHTRRRTLARRRPPGDFEAAGPAFTVEYEPRPFMGPAREKAEPQTLEFFRDSVT
jgi:hypothetical protein